MSPWKKKLIQAEGLTGNLGRTVYQRTKLLVEVFDDAEFRAEAGCRDDIKAADFLTDKYCGGVALHFLDLRDMLMHFPEESMWEKADFYEMHGQVIEARDAKKAAEEGRKPPQKRHVVTRREFDQVKQQLEGKEKELESSRVLVKELFDRIAGLERENAHLREENGRLKSQLSELAVEA
jgi:hypothetical protein